MAHRYNISRSGHGNNLSLEHRYPRPASFCQAVRSRRKSTKRLTRKSVSLKTSIHSVTASFSYVDLPSVCFRFFHDATRACDCSPTLKRSNEKARSPISYSSEEAKSFGVSKK